MGPVIALSLLIVALFVALCYLVNESRIELDSPTIAAMEAHTEAVEAKRESEPRAAEAPVISKPREPEEKPVAPEPTPPPEPMPPIEVSSYEYRDMLNPSGENYVLPQWMANYFSSSDVCHTLDESDSVVVITKLNDAAAAESGLVEIAAESDMTSQTFTLKLCFGEGATAEILATKFYMFERGDLFELSRLSQQAELRIDVLTRGSDYTLDYACSAFTEIPEEILAQLKDILSKIRT